MRLLWIDEPTFVKWILAVRHSADFDGPTE